MKIKESHGFKPGLPHQRAVQRWANDPPSLTLHLLTCELGTRRQRAATVSSTERSREGPWRRQHWPPSTVTRVRSGDECLQRDLRTARFIWRRRG